MNRQNLYSYIFWCNPFEDLYYAIERDSYLEFFNGNRDKAVFHKAKDFSVLEELICREDILKKLNIEETDK